jgi:hypothetical protein
MSYWAGKALIVVVGVVVVVVDDEVMFQQTIRVGIYEYSTRLGVCGTCGGWPASSQLPVLELEL